MNLSFLLKTAWRDARTQWGKLMLFISSIVLGIAALVAINSFNDNIVQDIDRQSASILGADVVISSNKELPSDIIDMIDSLPGESAKEYQLFSMAFIPSTQSAQFIRLKVVEGNFPFYGKLVTEPAEAGTKFKSSKRILADQGFMDQYGLSNGDSLKLGEKTFAIEGGIKQSFGGAALTSGFAPSVYLPFSELDNTKLIQPGSLIDYNYYQKTPNDFDLNVWKKSNSERFENESIRVQTIDDQRENLNEAFDALNAFLNLVALVSLLLGCIGVASSVFIYIKNKISTIAIFRCLGMKGNHAFFIFLIQILILGIIGSILGAALGTGIQLLLPRVFSEFLPFEVVTNVSWPSIFQGLSLGFLITVLFALIPLLSVRKISPLRTLRTSFEEENQGKDIWVWATYLAIISSVFLFLWQLTGGWLESIVFVIGILLSFLILYVVSSLIIWAVRKFLPRNWSFVFRQGLSNLYRPNNQTQILLVSLGLGTAILSTLFIVQGLILQSVGSMDAGNQPNMIVYGIESNQSEAIRKQTKDLGLPIIEQVPIVTMRIAGWQGRSKSDWLADSTRTAKKWAINREIRTSYKSELGESETLVAGVFRGKVNQPSDSIFISLDQGFAEDLDVELGDEIEFNVQGMLLKTYISSFREIDFTNMRTRFFILFPTGVLESAPQFEVMVTKSPSTEMTNQFRTSVVESFPNVSVVDLSSILTTVNEILNKISYAIQFMAGFSILTGLIVLLSSLILSKFQRIRESVLLRTLGASRRQILSINATEYTLIGVLSALTGILISLLSAWLVVTFQLDLDFSIRWLPIAGTFIFIVALTIIIGLWSTRDVVNKSPLETLRKDLQ